MDTGLIARPADWVFSCYRDYVGVRQNKLPQPDIVQGLVARRLRRAPRHTAHISQPKSLVLN